MGLTTLTLSLLNIQGARVIKHKYLKVDTNKDGIITDLEINNAITVLEKAKKQKDKERNQTLMNYYQNLT